MKYCNGCADARDLPASLIRESGTCDICGRRATCNRLSDAVLRQAYVMPVTTPKGAA